MAGTTAGRIVRLIFLFEGVSMAITGPILMAAPKMALELFGVKNPSDAAAGGVAWFGALVFLMGWVESRSWGAMTKFEVEGWLLADFAFLAVFVPWINSHGVWNFWSAVCSAGFPIVYAPIRLYWLLCVGGYDYDPGPGRPRKSDASPARAVEAASEAEAEAEAAGAGAGAGKATRSPSPRRGVTTRARARAKRSA
eukprot:tig00001024_g6317.t1